MIDRVLRSIAVELRQLRAVEAVARLCHFTRTAEELHVAQSALSHQISQLERELGTPLFERTSRRVRPTEAGTVMAGRARNVMAELDGAAAEIDELRGLRAAGSGSAPAPSRRPRRPRHRGPFQPRLPGHRGRAARGRPADMFEPLTTGDLDAAFCLARRRRPRSSPSAG